MSAAFFFPAVQTKLRLLFIIRPAKSKSLFGPGNDRRDPHSQSEQDLIHRTELTTAVPDIDGGPVLQNTNGIN